MNSYQCLIKGYKSLIKSSLLNSITQYSSQNFVECETHKILKVINLVLYYCKRLSGYYTQDLNDLVPLVNEHLTRDTTKETFKPDEPSMTNEKHKTIYTQTFRQY